MGVGKSIHDAIGIVVCGAAVPAVQPRVGAKLYHAKGNDGAGEGVPVKIGADKRVYVFCNILLGWEVTG